MTSASLENEERLVKRKQDLRPGEKEFIAKCLKIMDGHLDDQDFSMSDMADALAMSYNRFYVKIKNLTGENPAAYFTKYRMNRALKLLKEGKWSVSQVSDMVGASSVSNFTRSFKKEFGFTPSSITSPQTSS